MIDNELLLSQFRCNKLFDKAMSRALSETYKAPFCSNEQIMASWESVRQRLNVENIDTGEEKECLRILAPLITTS
ncbi:MAG: hypothetical protein WD469_02600 [Paenibacillaceae bacterium]